MDEPRGDNAADVPPWDEVTAGFVDLGTRIRSFFEANGADTTTDEVRNAWSDFTDAAGRLGKSVASAFQDEDVQAGAKRAFSSLIDAVGQTVRDTGGRWTHSSPDDDHPGDDQASAEEEGEE